MRFATQWLPVGAAAALSAAVLCSCVPIEDGNAVVAGTALSTKNQDVPGCEPPIENCSEPISSSSLDSSTGIPECDGGTDPQICDDGDACTTDRLVTDPNTCESRCEATLYVSECVSGDGCCPSQCNKTAEQADSDCEPICGNGLHEAAEACDGVPVSCGSLQGTIDPSPASCSNCEADDTSCCASPTLRTTDANKLNVFLGGSNVWLSMAVDANDRSHVAFAREMSFPGIGYAVQNAGGSWELSQAGEQRGTYPSIAIDPSGNPHITYYSNENDTLRYMRRLGNVWTTESPDVKTAVGRHSSLVLDDAGVPHVLFQRGRALGYTTKVAGEWMMQEIGIKAAYGAIGLAIDAKGDLHVSWHDSGALLYVSQAAGVWQKPVIVDPNSVGNEQTPNDLALAPDGSPRIAYRDSATESLRYARLVDGTWLVETAVPSGVVKQYGLGLAVNQFDQPHIVHYVSINGGRAVHTAFFDGSTWTSHVVDDSQSITVNIACDVALTSDGWPAFAYRAPGAVLHSQGRCE